MYKVLIITCAGFEPIAKTLEDISELNDKNIEITVRLHKSSNEKQIKTYIKKKGMRVYLDNTTKLYKQMLEANLNVTIAYKGISTVVLEGLLLKVVTIAYFPVGEKKFYTKVPDYCYTPVKTKKEFQTILKEGSYYHKTKHPKINRAKIKLKKKIGKGLFYTKIILTTGMLPIVLSGIIIKEGLTKIISEKTKAKFK